MKATKLKCDPKRTAEQNKCCTDSDFNSENDTFGCARVKQRSHLGQLARSEIHANIPDDRTCIARPAADGSQTSQPLSASTPRRTETAYPPNLNNGRGWCSVSCNFPALPKLFMHPQQAKKDCSSKDDQQETKEAALKQHIPPLLRSLDGSECRQRS